MAIYNEIKKLYSHALENEYIIGAYNIFNMETMMAVIDAAEEEHSPVICQIGPWTRAGFGPLKIFVKYFKEYSNCFKVPIVLHHDHCPTIQMCKDAVDDGFMSVMFDGSSLSFEENVNKTSEIVDYAHKQGVWVEAELGSLPGFEHDVFGGESKYTDPEMVLKFINSTKCDSLAIAVGTAHGGVIAEENLKLDINRLKRIKELVGDFPLVLHGAASLPFDLIDYVNQYGGQVPYLRMVSEVDIENTRHYGVAKVNMDVDNMLCFTGAIREFFVNKPESYNPGLYLAAAKTSWKNEVKHKMVMVTKSSGKADSLI